MPENTTEVTDHDWAAVCSKLGVPDLPTVYKEFVSTYGTGYIGNFLWVMNPFSANPNINLEKILYFRSAYQTLRQAHPMYYPREFGTFLPWAATDNGDSIVWLLDGNSPDDWQVVLASSQGLFAE